MKLHINQPTPHSKIQNLIMNFFMTSPLTREMWVSVGTKAGKAANIEADIPTLNGWKKLKDVIVGDVLFDENGKRCNVIGVSDVFTNRNCYEVVFSDGQKEIFDAEHLWSVESVLSRKHNDRYPDNQWEKTLITTEGMIDQLKYMVKNTIKTNYSVDCITSPVDYDEKKLPIDPYILGLWLAKGLDNFAYIPLQDNELREFAIYIFNEKGYHFFVKNKLKLLYASDRLFNELKINNLIENKHIPKEYLTASYIQRLSLIQGIFDAGLVVSQKGVCTYSSGRNPKMLDYIHELLSSIGIKCNKFSNKIEFVTTYPITNISAKINNMKPMSKKSTRRYIVEINKVSSIPVKCLRVDSPSNLFLITKSFIPTHNSLAASVAMATSFPLDKQSLSRWVAPIYSQAKVGFKYCQRMLPGEPYVTANNSDLSIRIPTRDSVLQFFHAQHAETLEGEAVKRYVFDECSKIGEDCYHSAQTTLTFTKGKGLYISTPRGKNWFYKRWMQAKIEMERAIKLGITPAKIAITAPTTLNPLIDKEIINDAKKNLPDRLFRQYYLAEFVDDGSVFTGFRDLLIGDELDFFPGSKQRWSHKDAAILDVVIGADWAKTTDFTVFTAWTFSGKRAELVGFERFQNRDYRYVIRDLVRFSALFRTTALIYHDKTGLGNVMDDLLSDAKLPYEGITFTNDSKTTMINQLMVAIQNRELLLPNWPDMRVELDAYEVQTTDLGKMKYSAPAGMHDDIVSSMMLGFAAASEIGLKSSFEVYEIGGAVKHDESVIDWYRTFDDD